MPFQLRLYFKKIKRPRTKSYTSYSLINCVLTKKTLITDIIDVTQFFHNHQIFVQPEEKNCNCVVFLASIMRHAVNLLFSVQRMASFVSLLAVCLPGFQSSFAFCTCDGALSNINSAVLSVRVYILERLNRYNDLFYHMFPISET